MKMQEKYKRLVKLLFSLVLTGLITAIYAYVWIYYFNERMLQAPFFRRGNWMMIFLYGVLLVFFMQMYGGYKVGYLKKGNLIYLFSDRGAGQALLRANTVGFDDAGRCGGDYCLDPDI